MAIAVHPPTGSLIIAVADGVGAAPQSHLGAAAACRYAVDVLSRGLDSGQEIDWEAVLKGAAWTVVETAQRIANLSAPDPVAAEHLCATTLCLVLVRPTADGVVATAVSAGDSGLLCVSAGRFDHVIGGKATKDGISSSAVSPLPRVPEPIDPREVVFGKDDLLLVATDGILGPLSDGSGLIGQLLLENLGVPPDPLQFCRLVDFSRETFDDDRTMVAVWLRPRPPILSHRSRPQPAAALPDDPFSPRPLTPS